MVDTPMWSALPLGTMGIRARRSTSNGVAVARVARSRGRVVLTAVLAVLTAGPLAACGATSTPPGTGPTGTETAPDGQGALGSAINTTPGVSVIVDRETLVLPDGRALSLAAIDGGAMNGYQTRDGW